MTLREELEKLRADMEQEWLIRHQPITTDVKRWGSEKVYAVEYQNWLETERERNAGTH